MVGDAIYPFIYLKNLGVIYLTTVLMSSAKTVATETVKPSAATATGRVAGNAGTAASAIEPIKNIIVPITMPVKTAPIILRFIDTIFIFTCLL